MATDNKALDQARALLRKHGYNLRQASLTGPANAPTLQMEWWSGPAGCVLLQWRPDFEGVLTFADWPLGSTFLSMDAALENACPHKHRTINFFEE